MEINRLCQLLREWFIKLPSLLWVLTWDDHCLDRHDHDSHLSLAVTSWISIQCMVVTYYRWYRRCYVVCKYQPTDLSLTSSRGISHSRYLTISLRLFLSLSFSLCVSLSPSSSKFNKCTYFTNIWRILLPSNYDWYIPKYARISIYLSISLIICLHLYAYMYVSIW